MKIEYKLALLLMGLMIVFVGSLWILPDVPPMGPEPSEYTNAKPHGSY